MAIIPSYVLTARRLELIQFSSNILSETQSQNSHLDFPSTACLICAGSMPSIMLQLPSNEDMESLIVAINMVYTMHIHVVDAVILNIYQKKTIKCVYVFFLSVVPTFFLLSL